MQNYIDSGVHPCENWYPILFLLFTIDIWNIYKSREVQRNSKQFSNSFEHMVNLVDLYPSTHHPYRHEFLPSLDSMKVQLIFTLLSLALGFCILLPVTSDFSGNHARFTFKVYLESHHFVIPHKKISFFLSCHDFFLHYCNSF